MKRCKAICRGTACLCAAIMLLAATAGSVLETNQNMVNSFLGTKTTMVEIADGEELYTAFSADYSSTDDLIAAHQRLGEQISAEGSVLLKNNGVLPLTDKGNITLLGLHAETKMDYGARVGAEIKTSQSITLSAALRERGFNVNQQMLDTYAALAKSKAFRKSYQLSPNFMGVKPGEEVKVELLEPTVSDIAAQDADYLNGITAYQDAAIVVLGRMGTEGADYFPGETGVDPKAGARNPLSLSNGERELLAFAKEHFEKVIVLLSCANPMEVGELEKDDGIDAILWIGYTGNYGTRGVASVLCGDVNPSGSLADIYASDSTSSPAMANHGVYKFANAEGTLDTMADRADYYLIEAEGIYTGYRYYETRYADCVMGQGNADSPVGAFDSVDGWRYNEEVVYPFGYGLSYTSFEKTLDSVTVSIQDKTITSLMTVKNTGSVAGKTSMQLYAQAPYIAGGVEKSAIQLVDFGKTRLLMPGESQTIVLVTELQNISSYDEAAGCYILDAGNYSFTVADNSHEAINNVLVHQGYGSSPMMDGRGDASAVKVWAYAPQNGRDTDTFAVSKAGVKVENQLAEADFNHFAPGTVTQLSRSDWEATWPKSYRGLSFTDEMLPYLKNDFYQIATGDDTSALTFGADNGLIFAAMKDVPYEDERWQLLIDQMTIQEAAVFTCVGNMVYRSVPSIGFIGGNLANDCPTGFKDALGIYSDPNSPNYVSPEDPNANYEPHDLPSPLVIAAAFDKELAYQIGVLIGNDGLFGGLCILWGPGINLHRTPYNGRNCEYYSEDPVLTGYLGAACAGGALTKGTITAGKHFAFNDQESNRNGVCTFMTEQKARELELRGYQLAIENGMMGLMTAFNRIGATYVSASKGLIGGILEGEWGFNGYVITDMLNPPTYMTWKESIMAGTTIFDSVRPQEDWSAYLTEDDNHISGDAALLSQLKEAVHRTLYAFSKTNVMNRLSASSTVKEVNNWWRLSYKISFYASTALFTLSLIGYVVTLLCGKRKEGKRA